jgi:glycerate 2-kinase
LSVPSYLPADRSGRLLVIGFGKASAAMAKAVEDHWQGPISGLVVTRSGYSAPCRQTEIVEAAHPVPDAKSMAAATAMLRKVVGLTDQDQVLCLASGGGSSLLSLPIAGLDPSQKQLIHASLIASGANISEINCVRRHLSAIKGSRLGATRRCRQCSSGKQCLCENRPRWSRLGGSGKNRHLGSRPANKPSVTPRAARLV